MIFQFFYYGTVRATVSSHAQVKDAVISLPPPPPPKKKKSFHKYFWAVYNVFFFFLRLWVGVWTNHRVFHLCSHAVNPIHHGPSLFVYSP